MAPTDVFNPSVTRLALLRGLGLALALVGGGCAVGPDYRAPGLSLPARWSQPAPGGSRPAAAPAEWWKGFGDPVLDGIVTEAVAGNLDVASALARIREARANRRVAIGGLFPTLDGSASATRSRSSQANGARSATGGNLTSSLYQAGFDASWELDLFGANARNVEATTYGVQAADEDLQGTLLTLVGDVVTTYAEARGYQARIALARSTAASQRETERLTRTKLEAGSASGVDAAKAAALASGTEAEIPSLEALYAQSVHQLGILTGREPGALAARLAAVRPIPAPRRTPPAGIPADVLRNRPDVRRAERQLAQYTARIGQAQAALYPQVSLTGSIATSALRTGDLAKNSSISWSFGPTLSVPIFNGGELQAEVDVARAQRDQYDAAFRLSVLTALQDVENGLVNWGKERQRLAKLASEAASYREAARLSRTLYQTGASSFLDVLDAERSLYSAEDTLLQSRVAVATDFVALNKALGGGWSRPVVQTVPLAEDGNTGPHWRSPPAAQP